jgi:hypothetical protein
MPENYGIIFDHLSMCPAVQLFAVEAINRFRSFERRNFSGRNPAFECF